MELLQLKYYVAVVQEGSISQAAKALEMTQPPVSMQVRLLERELGCTLFERGSRSITLTEEGKLFYEQALRILNMSKSAALAVANCHNATTGTLRAGIVSSLIDLTVDRWFTGFAALHPQVNYELTEGTTYELLDKLQNRLLDLALVRTPFSSRGFTCINLAPEDMYIIGKKKWLEGLPVRVKPSQAAALPLLVYRRWSKVLDSAFAAQGCKPRLLCVTDDARTCLSWARSGLGVAVVPADMLGENPSPLPREPVHLPAGSCEGPRSPNPLAAGLEHRILSGLAPAAAITLALNESGCDTAVGREFVKYFKASLACPQ
jgi:DNA-binding transcriptional LysR family regulator